MSLFLVKSAVDWNGNELLSYRIDVTPTPPEQFFHQGADPPLTGIDPALLTADLDATDVSDSTHLFLRQISLAIHSDQRPATVDFAREFLALAGFRKRGFCLCTRHTIPLSIYGNDKVAQPDVCLKDEQSGMILLVLAVDKTMLTPQDEVIADAIAAYQHNKQLLQNMGLGRLETMTIPCVTLTGTWPTFYLVPVTEELSNAVMEGREPKAETKVLKCITSADPIHSEIGRMKKPEYRRLAFQRMIAFHTLAKSHWEQFLSA